MRHVLLTLSILVNIGLVVTAVWLIGHNSNDSKRSLPEDFRMECLSNKWFIAYRDGLYSWSIESNMVTMHCGLRQAATFLVDQSNHVERIVLELNPTNGSGYYVSDFNADGIADEIKLKGSWDRLIFFQGQFVRRYDGAGGTVIVVNGSSNTVWFDKDHWTAEPRSRL